MSKEPDCISRVINTAVSGLTSDTDITSRGTQPKLYVETRPPFIWTGKNEYRRVEIWVDGCWMGKKTVILNH